MLTEARDVSKDASMEDKIENSRGNVLLIMDSFQKYEHRIPEELRKLGYAAQWCDARPSNSVLAKMAVRLGLMQRIGPAIRANTDRMILAARAAQADTLFLVSQETVRGPQLKQLRQALPGIRIILYAWDSSANRHLDQEMIDRSDVAYSFDLDDCARFNNLYHIPLFHPHQVYKAPKSTLPRSRLAYDYCFIGSSRSRRLKMLAHIGHCARKRNRRYFFFLFAPSFLQYAVFWVQARWWGYDGNLSRTSMGYEQYLETLRQSACVIDIEQAEQGGLTIRTMDTVFAGLPLATSNKNISRYDFFPHFPISMFSASEAEIEFPKKQDTVRAMEFFEKYKISTWLETILSGQPPNYRLDHTGHNENPSPEAATASPKVGA